MGGVHTHHCPGPQAAAGRDRGGAGASLQGQHLVIRYIEAMIFLAGLVSVSLHLIARNRERLEVWKITLRSQSLARFG